MTDSIISLHVGTCFGDDSSPTEAVLRYRLATDTGVLTSAGDPIKITDGENPGWLSRYVSVDDKQLVYISMEDEPGKVQAYEVVGQDNGLQPHGPAVETKGKNPCYGQLDKTGKWLLMAHYTQGSVSVVKVKDDGTVEEGTCSITHAPGGPTLDPKLKDRQEEPHAHCIVPHPSNQYVVVPDLGLSKVFLYKFDANKGLLTSTESDLQVAPDAGCRHCCWNQEGDVLYVVNELNYTLTVASFSDGKLQEECSVYLLQERDNPDRSHHRGGSDIAIHPNGKYLYVGCRCTSPGVIAIMEIVNAKTVKVIGHESTRGEVPRNFKLLGANAEWLVVGNQDGKSVVSYAVDGETGKLEFKSEISTKPYKACNIASPDAWYA